MVDFEYKISLDMSSASSDVCLNVKKADTGRKICVGLTENGFPYHISDDCYAVFTAIKPDGNVLYNDCSIKDCVIIYEFTPQTAAVVGLTKCEIRLYGADDRLITSPSFLLMVGDTVYEDGAVIESEKEISALTALISDAAEVINKGNKVNAESEALILELEKNRSELEQNIVDTRNYANSATTSAQGAAKSAEEAKAFAEEARKHVENAAEVFVGNENTKVAEFYAAYIDKKVCFMRRPMGGSGYVTWVASQIDSNMGHFYRVAANGEVVCGILNNNIFEYQIDSGGEDSVFVGDENTTVAEYYEADQAGKMCFMRRPQGGSGITNWVAYGCSSTTARFYHINSTGMVEYGYLDNAGQFTYQTAKSGISADDLEGYATEKWVQEGYQPKGNYLTSVPTAQQVGADPAGTAASAVSQHNTSIDAHGDLRIALKAIAARLTAFLDSDDATLDQLSELIAGITSNKTLIEAVTTSKVNVADIINNLDTNVANKPLSAAQGVVLKGLIDSLNATDIGAVSTHQLPAAINTALAQAKESGEFKGDPGKTPVKGEDYYTEADKAEMVDAVIAALPDASEVKY